MPTLLIKGSYPLIGGRSDGDTVHFQPDKKEEWQLVPGPHNVQHNGSGQAKLRLDAIDALETHSSRTGPEVHQPLLHAHAARDELTRWLGFTDVQLPDPANRVTLSDQRDGLDVPRPKIAHKIDDHSKRALAYGHALARRIWQHLEDTAGATEVEPLQPTLKFNGGRARPAYGRQTGRSALSRTVTVTTRLVIARHGEARCNTAGRVGGPKTCTGLTDAGRFQIERLAARLAAEQDAGNPVGAVYAGPRRRLQESGRLLADGLGLPLLTDPGLDGPRHGQADGMLWREVEASFRGAPYAHPNRPCAPDAEPWNSYLTRVTRHLAGLLERHDGGHVLLAAHGETLHAVCRLLLGIPVSRSPVMGFGATHAGLTRFELRRDDFGDTRWILAVLNDTAHLRGPG
ncbi:histidine phosphatase family protein [Streptomyces sp. NBC_00190]|uniref:histidine phosphatase family protein n=1 Tax=unclassified Streptomyces TaxID=2593676 RepID=UPI002E2A734C|nr:histidine phosphatase family protein [Streptomyces sp. NBC_00190]WSZ44476.1 histidine phosphatase family protein [Streptomyces sp. NBC_00868]